MKFGERMGLVPVNNTIQTTGMTIELQNSLWNILDMFIWSPYGFHDDLTSNSAHELNHELWFSFYKERLDTIPWNAYQVLNKIRDSFYNFDWIRAYEFIEFIVEFEKDERMELAINEVLESELAGYRLIDRQFVPITEEAEKEAVEMALESGPFAAASSHVRQALHHLSNKKHPDYRNSIKESISAVESIACELSGKTHATLGDALKELEREGQLHGALKNGFSALYGYTSDSNGIRHAMLTESKIDADDAKYFLVTCAAFVNYLKAKHSKGK